MQVVVLADIQELPSLTLSQELLRPKKLTMVKQILDEGVAMIVPAFATSPSLPAEEGSRLARLLVSGASPICRYMAQPTSCALYTPDTQHQCLPDHIQTLPLCGAAAAYEKDILVCPVHMQGKRMAF